MKTNSSIQILLLGLSLFCGGQNVFAKPIEFSQLSAADQEKIKNGAQASMFTEVPGEHWPDANIYQLISNVKPEEAAASFGDYNLQSTYIPFMKKSAVSKIIDKATVQIDYTVTPDFGIKATENYTVEDHIEYDKMKGSYHIGWKLVRGDTTKISVGYAHFEPMGTGTLLSYYSFVETTHWGADLPFVKKRMKETLQNVVTEIMKHVQTEKASNPNLLREEMMALEKAVN